MGSAIDRYLRTQNPIDSLVLSGPSRTQLSPQQETEFQSWYSKQAKRAGIDPDPDNPLHKYDYRGAFLAGEEPQISSDGMLHWSSRFKDSDHPNRFVGGVDTKAVDNPIDAMTEPRSIVPENSGVGTVIWEALKEQGRELVQFGKYALTSAPVMGVPNPMASRGVFRDVAAAEQGDEEAKKRLDRGLRGGALAASTVVSGGAAGALKAASVMGPLTRAATRQLLAKKALAFTASEALGGATFGAVKPLEEDESRAGAIATDAALFPIAGAALHGAFKGVGKVFQGTMSKLSDRAAAAAKKLNEKQAKAVAERTAKIADDMVPESAPPEAVEFAHTQALEEALEPITEKQFQEELAAITPKSVDTPAPGTVRFYHGGTVYKDGPRWLSPDKAYAEAYARKSGKDGIVQYVDIPEDSPFLQTISDMSGTNMKGGYSNFDAPEAIAKQLKPLSEEAAALARVEAARTTPFPGTEAVADIPPRISTELIPPETIVAPATKVGDRVFQGSIHILARQAARDAGALEVGGNFVDGFVTSTGRFVGRDEALRIAESAKQPEINVAAAKAGEEGLDALDFQKRADITPGEVAVTDEPPVELQNVLAQAADQPGPVAEAAVADAVMTAVVEATPIVEVMSERAAKETAEVTASKALVEAADEPTFLDLYAGDKLTGVTHKALEADNLDPLIEQVAKTIEGGIEEIKPTWQAIVADTQPEGSTAWNVLAKLTGDQLDSIEKAVQRFGMDQTGVITARMAVRLAAGGTAGMLEMAAQEEDDPQTKSMLRYAAGFLGLAAVLPGNVSKSWLTKTKFTRNIIKWNALDKLMSDGTKEGLATWQGLMATGRTAGKMLENDLRRIFPDEKSNIAAMHVLDRGQSAMEWNLLNAEQQKEALSQHLLNLNLGKLMQSLGILDEYRENYVRHLLPTESFNRWRGQNPTLGTKGPFTQARKVETLAELQEWAKANNVPGPVMNLAKVQSFHMQESYRAIAGNRLKAMLEGVGMIQEIDPAKAMPEGWRQIRVTNFPNKMAPDDAATLIERAAGGGDKFGLETDAFKAMDTLKGFWMRTIMLWAWEHGINQVRAGMAIDGTGLAAAKAYQAIKRSDPVMLEAARYGLDMFHRPDHALKHSEAFENTLKKLGDTAPTLAKISGGIKHQVFDRGERALWDKWVPAVALGAWTNEMRKWTQRTGGKYLVGSPEYVTAARNAAKFANTVSGKVPELIQSNASQFLMRQALFSPSWLRTRMSITAHAAGDLTKVLSGELNPRDASYLAYKTRAVLLGVAATYAMSKVFTGTPSKGFVDGKEPKFNPNSNKFYARTGLKDSKGREQGLDLIGWWQDDIKLFSDPFSFFRDRQNPMIRAAQTAVTGRDQFGQEVTGMDRIENILLSFGPGAEAGQVLAQAAKGHMNSAEKLRGASGILAVGNVAALPKPIDAAISKMATKILRVNGLPQNDDRVWELSRMMRQNFAMSGSLYGGNLNTWIAYQRRTYKRSKTLGPLWNEARRALRDMGRD